MKHNVRRALSTIALTSLAATMVACQAGPQQLRPGAGIPVGAQNVRGQSVATSPTMAAVNAAARQNLPAVPGEFLVKMKPGASAQSALAQSSGLRAMNVQARPIGNPQTGIVLMKSSGLRAQSAAADQQTLAALRSNPAVLYAEPNYIVKLNLPAEPAAPFNAIPSGAAPNDPMYSRQYAHKLTSSEAGWAIEQGKNDFVLAIVDTGVDVKHPDLASKMLPGYNAFDDNTNVTDGNGHGTHCAGIAAALTNNGVGVAGYAPNVKILPVQVLSAEGSGSYATVAAGIVWAADHGAKVISMSLGGPSNSPVVAEAVKYALSKDAMLIAAMGNSGRGANGNTPIKSYPAAIPGVMSVGATDSKDALARFSQMGEWNSVTAPGVDILSTFPVSNTTDMPSVNGYGSISGTSMATPAVAGLAALVRSKYPQLNAAQAEAHIEATSDDLGDPGYDQKFGAGRINVAKALSTAPGAAAMLRR